MIFEIKNQKLVGVVANFKVATSSIARAVIKAHHPAIESLITSPHGDGKGTAYPEGLGPDNSLWQGLCPKISDDAVGPVAILIRNPIDRFVSACHQFQLDPQAMLDGVAVLRAGRKIDLTNPHFVPQTETIAKTKRVVHVYRMPRDLEAFCKAIGVSGLLRINDGRGKPHPIPTLTDSQKDQLRIIYSEDLRLFESEQQVVEV